jgi:hypothetical protein
MDCPVWLVFSLLGGSETHFDPKVLSAAELCLGVWMGLWYGVLLSRIFSGQSVVWNFGGEAVQKGSAETHRPQVRTGISASTGVRSTQRLAFGMSMKPRNYDDTSDIE